MGFLLYLFGMLIAVAVEGLGNFPPPTPSTHYRNSLLYSHKDVVKMPHKPIYSKNLAQQQYNTIVCSEWSTRF